MALERLTKLLLAGSESPPDKDDSLDNLAAEFRPKLVSQLYLKRANTSLFYRLFSVFSNKLHYNFYNKYMEKMSIQYTVLQSKPMTFGT